MCKCVFLASQQRLILIIGLNTTPFSIRFSDNSRTDECYNHSTFSVVHPTVYFDSLFADEDDDNNLFSVCLF